MSEGDRQQRSKDGGIGGIGSSDYLSESNQSNAYTYKDEYTVIQGDEGDGNFSSENVSVKQ